MFNVKLLGCEFIVFNVKLLGCELIVFNVKLLGCELIVFNVKLLGCELIVFNVKLLGFPKLAEKLSVIRTDRHENLVSPKNILPVRKKVPKNSLSHA